MIYKLDLLDFLISQKEAYLNLSLDKTTNNLIIYQSKIELINDLINIIHSGYFDRPQKYN